MKGFPSLVRTLLKGGRDAKVLPVKKRRSTMREQHHQQAETISELQFWTDTKTVRALPYLRAVVHSLREHWLEMQQARQQIRRLDARPGRADRQALLLREEAGREAELAKERFEETLGELMALGVYCRDPAKGLVLIPLHKGDAVTWLVFDLFAPHGQEFSRFHADPLETQRAPVEKLDPGFVDQVFSSPRSDISMFPPGRPSNGPL
jgi:hypothetical protein